MKTKFNALALIISLASTLAMAQDLAGGGGGQEPPPQAYQDCVGKKVGDSVQHSTREGTVSATCESTPNGLAARPVRSGDSSQSGRQERPPEISKENGQSNQEGSRKYSLDQAISDNAQLKTIAFNGLAFITGEFGASTFIPPGKVSDFFGFQYMRDVDAAEKGHNPKFLDRVAGNVLKTLDKNQRALFEREANAEATKLRDLAYRRFPLISAYHAQLNNQIPPGSSGLNKAAVAKYTGEMFAADASLAYQRAAVFGRIVSSMTASQKASLARMQFGNFNSWPKVDMEQYKLARGSDKMVNVAYMTLASEFFSWYAGSIEADTYFCPERHGTYFGGFYMKDMPAMGKKDYDISTSLTDDQGEAFMQTLNQDQRDIMNGVVESQRKPLAGIVEVRRAIATELRKFLNNQTSDRSKVLSLGRRYGELDGELAYLYATAFARINKTLTPTQRSTLKRLRNESQYVAAPAYLYSEPLHQLPQVSDAASLFYAPK